MQRVHVIGVLCAMGLLASTQAGPGMPGGFRISDMGPPGDPAFGARSPAVAYNGATGEFLVVWWGDDETDGAFEIFCQRIDAATGAEVGPDDLRISDMGPAGDPVFDGIAPDVAYNSAANEYLVVWYGDDETEWAFEIFCQRIDAEGNEIGRDDARISATDPDCGSHSPSVAYNVRANEYLVVWTASCAGDLHVFGQLLDATGAEIGADDFMIDDGVRSAKVAAVAYNSTTADYLVVWWSSDHVVVRRLDAGGLPLTEELLIADVFLAVGSSLEVAYDEKDNEYLVVWYDGDDSLAPGEFEIFGQRLDATGAEIGADDFRISDMGTEGDPEADARSPDVAYDPIVNQYLVVWHGDDGTPPLGEGEWEIFGQRIDAGTGTEVGPNDFRISRMGPDGDPAFVPNEPTAAVNAATGEFLVVWRSDDDTPPQVDDDSEILIRRLGCPWDCGDDDGAVGTADLLALLGQWGAPGTCDADGGGVGTTDLLELLANWGPCPK